MTVQDASNELFTWFETGDSFEINRDIKKIVPIMDSEEETIIAFKIALEKLEEAQLVSSKDYGDKRYYILEKHMDAFQQQVEVGPWSAKFISGEINEFCNMVQDNTDICQTSNIQEKDVRNLVHIIQFYRQKVLEKEQIISSHLLPDGETADNGGLLDKYNAGLSLGEQDSDDDDEEPPKKKKKK